MKYALHSCSFTPTHVLLWGEFFLLFLIDPVVLTLLDKVAMSKSLSLNSSKKILVFGGFF